eukprot:6124049-Pyramimonas_sp.AAC.4
MRGWWCVQGMQGVIHTAGPYLGTYTHIPIEGLGLVGGCGIFPWRDWDWSVYAAYCYGAYPTP